MTSVDMALGQLNLRTSQSKINLLKRVQTVVDETDECGSFSRSLTCSVAIP